MTLLGGAIPSKFPTLYTMVRRCPFPPPPHASSRGV